MSSRRLINRLCNWMVPAAAAADQDVVTAAGELHPLLYPNNCLRLPRGKIVSTADESLTCSSQDEEEKSMNGTHSSNQEKDQRAEKDVSLFHLDNLAIPMAYLIFGLMQGLVKTFLNVYPLDCGATESQQTTLASITTLPCAMKILYGFISDNVPVCGYRRKPYILLGWLLASSMATILLTTCDLSLSTTTTTTTTTTIASSSITATTTTSNDHFYQPSSPKKQKHPPSMELLSLIFFVLGIGIWYADSVCDAVVAEKTQREQAAVEKQQQQHAQAARRPAGSIQSTCYVARYTGILMASTLSTYLYSSSSKDADGGTGTGSSDGPQTVVFCIAALPWLLFPFLYCFKENQHVNIHSVQHQSAEIWKTICSRTVWEPMSFIYIFNLLQVPNPAWRQFLSTVYHFSSVELNLLVVTTYALLLTGMILYKCCFLNTSWRRIFIICIIFNAIASTLQLVMIQGRIPRSWNPFWFALGDDALMDLMHGIQKLPITILMMSLCPAGSEGVSYAMLTTLDNSAHMLSQALSTALLGLPSVVIGDTSKSALAAGNMRGIFHLSIVTTLLQVSPIVIIAWMPRNRHELFALRDKAWSGSPLGGVAFLVVLVASMIWTISISLLNVMYPDWNGGF
jgi:BT1 family